MSHSETHVLKFGGSSQKNASLIQQSAQIVIDRLQEAQPVVVVSAIGGVTDTLIEIAEHYQEDSSHKFQKLNELENRHRQLFDELVSISHPNRGDLQDLFVELRSTLNNHKFRNEHFNAWKDQILSIGERASAIIFAAVLSEKGYPAQSYEAHQFIKTDSTFGQAKVDRSASRQLIQKFILNQKAIPVITGFIGSNDNNSITTLGRSGSDYTAGLVADALDADHLEIWTDVDGVLTADPRWVPDAESIEQLSFSDISELSSHGARVIHPKTIQPIQNKKTTVLVKNSYNPKHPGTLITSDFNTNGSLKTITITGPFVRLQIDQKYAYDLFIKLNEWSADNPNAKPIEFSQQTEFEAARFLLKQSFFEEIKDKLSAWISRQNTLFNLDDNLYKVKKFSNQFNEDEKLSEEIISLFNDNNIKPLHTERNVDERFISFLLPEDEARRAAQLINNSFTKKKPTVDLFIAGTGAVGQTLLDQLKNIDSEEFQFNLLGTCNSRKMLWDADGLPFEENLNWKKSLETDWDLLIEKLTVNRHHNLIFVDATGSEQVARLYPKLFANGIHVVTPSKLANTFEQSFFDKLQKLTQDHDVSFKYETTVGAGLPVISTIKDLQSSSDEITKISGVVSGTMTYLFNQLEQGVPFSKAIIEAREKGYAEPDPRDDLSGEDVARKFLTLARTLGINIEREELQVESLIPKELKHVDEKTFLNELSDYDSEWKQRINSAKERNETLRYTGTLKNGKIAIGIESVPKDSPLGQLQGTDNLIQVYSNNYSNTPLVIQGPGAGKEVTASGVLSDIIKTANLLIK
ncbi:aspartate kinase [Fodinibius sp.]|uniref:aspartate kinase n=1 Tax=Fodinibius sp. TaxID=1872440 RepID=UPI002ACD3619|nr:aspartate kinase [Fodinibius sp.]MDZ7658242.1 aspartate kinase [Fodinibius sp.]